MSLNLDKSAWKRVKLGEVATASKEKVDPTAGSVDRYVAGEHMASDDLKIHRWGNIGDVDLGPAFHRRFRPGQVLYGSRRTYLRKVAVADFNGVCANTTFVVETRNRKVLLQEFLPFIMTAEPFHSFAIAESKGSVNPYVNWTDIEQYEFDLPPLDEQKRLAELLWVIEDQKIAVSSKHKLLLEAQAGWRDNQVAVLFRRAHTTLGDLVDEGIVSFLTGPFGSTLSAKEYVSDGVPVIHPSHIVEGRVTVDHKSTVTPNKAKQLSRWKVRCGDLVLMRKGDVGRSAIITRNEVGWVIGSDCISVRLQENAQLLPEYLRLALSTPEAMTTLLRNAPGTTMPGINERSLRPIAVPDISISEQQQLLAGDAHFTQAVTQLTNELKANTSLTRAILLIIFGGSQ